MYQILFKSHFQADNQKFVKLFTQNFHYYLAYFIFSFYPDFFCVYPLHVTESTLIFFVGNYIN